jgi:hypothetical protein
MKNAAVTVVALALALAACNKAAEPDAAASGTVAAPAPAGGAAGGGGDAVQAVLQSTGEPVAKLQFVLESRPVAGKPFPLQLHVSAPAPVSELQLAAESPDLIIAPASATLALPEANTTVVQEIVVTAPREGLMDLHVRLRGADAPETVYAVPVLVAAGAAP